MLETMDPCMTNFFNHLDSLAETKDGTFDAKE